jgi:O-antigen/teichoic acid export membrane protein
MAVPLTVVVLAVGGLASGVDLVGSAVTAALVLWRAYYSASYRIRIDYRKNLLSSVFSVVGYSLGLALARATGQWTLAFITGELFACAYIAFTGHIVREGTGRTDLMGHTLRKYILLFSGAALGSLSLYMDRLLVYPMLGGTEVSTYTVASFLGKSAGLLMGPIAGVLLTYYAKATTLSRGQFARQVSAMVVTAVSAYALILLIGKPITIALYPTIAASAMPYFAVANLASIAFVAGNMIHPSVLRFCDLKWQPAIQGAYLISYVVLGVLGTHLYGLWGLCWAVLAVNTLRGVGMIGLVLRRLGSECCAPLGDAVMPEQRYEQELAGQGPTF